MKFETLRIHFSLTFLVCCHTEILLPGQRDVTTSPLKTKIRSDAIKDEFIGSLTEMGTIGAGLASKPNTVICSLQNCYFIVAIIYLQDLSLVVRKMCHGDIAVLHQFCA